MQNAAQLTNPLGLEVVYATSVTPPHEVTDEAKRIELTAAMDADGWTGAPIVADRELNAYGQDKAYTGSHRIEAWSWTDYYGDPIPCVFIEDIAEKLGLDWDALVEQHDGDTWLAATAVAHAAPTEIHDAYGLDIDGA